MTEKVCRTVRQFSSRPVPKEDMQKLLEIAADYARVKNYVYQRYGGIGSLSKIYPGYTVQNEMTSCGLRMELNLPSVYFYLAVFDALGDIKGQWSTVKTKISGLAGRNENLSPEEKHYLRFLLKTNNAFEAVLNKKQVVLPKELQKKYEELSGQADCKKMQRYLCRQVRKYHAGLHTDAVTGFSTAERAYRYADHGIYLSTKQNRKRIFVPLTDNNQYKSQLYISLYPQENRIEIKAAVETAVHYHADYAGGVGIAFGMTVMLTTDRGTCYGEEFGAYHRAYADYIREQTGIYKNNRKDNPGRKKYYAKKQRLEEQMHSYINHELNRFLKTEKPRNVYLAKMPKPQGIKTKGNSAQGAFGKKKQINHSVSIWQRGYIRKRLEQKCREQSVELAEVPGKGISLECSRCGARGSRKDGLFSCENCGYQAEEKTNTAENALKRGLKKGSGTQT